MEFLPVAIESYAVQHSSPQSELLQHIDRETHLKVLMPRMLSGHLQGRVLSMFSHMIKPQRVLEIGTYTGYSALCLAEGLTIDGKIITLDINAEIENMVRGFFAQSKYDARIDYRIGNAIEIIPTLEETFDLVFIDADKENYSRYFDLIIDKVRPGGFIIADNVLWSGKVLQTDGKIDKDTRALQAFNEKIHADERVEHVLMPIRDGLMVCRKR